MSRGIDYGLGQTNIDRENGIRFGVISMHSLSEWAYEDFEADYGPACCPKCGNEAVDYNSEVHLDLADYGMEEDDVRLELAPDPFEMLRKHSCADYACESCNVIFGSDEAFGDEPQGHYLDDGEYKATLHSDNDVFILKSPYFTRAQFCSPCAPGACHLDNPCEDGERCYAFGHDWFPDKVAPYPVWSVATGEPVLPEAKPEELADPTLKAGYAFLYTGEDWEKSSAEDWPTETVGESDVEGSVIVGCRFIDGTKCNVFKLTNGTYAAQLELVGH